MKWKRRNLPSLEDVSRTLAEPDVAGVSPGSIQHSIGLMLIFSAFVGEDPEQLSIATGLKLDEVRAICWVLEKNKVFGQKVDHFKDYFRGEVTGTVLNVDILCGQNRLTRSYDGGEAKWSMTRDGIAWTRDLIELNPGARKLLNELAENWIQADKAYREKNTKPDH